MPRSVRYRVGAAVVLAAVLLVPGRALAAGTAPVLAGHVSDPMHLSGTTSVAVSGQYAYTTAYYSGELTAVNISNPSSPTIVGESSPFTDPNLTAGSNVTIAGGYAFVVSKNRNQAPDVTPNVCNTGNNDDGTGNSLTILDIHTDPTHPSIVGTIHDTSKLFGSYGIAVSGNYAYVAYQGILGGEPCAPDTSTGGFSVIDITTMTIVANIDNGSLPAPWAGTNALQHATSVAVSGTHAYVTAFYSARFTVIDISNPTSPRIVASLPDATNLSFNVDVALQGNYAYVADQAGGSSPQLTVVDVSNPTAPHVVGTLSASSVLSGAYRIRVRGNFVYESASSVDTVAAIDVSDPVHPRLAGSLADTVHLHRTTGLDVDPSGGYVVASSPYLSTQSKATYPPYPFQAGGPTITGTISVIQLDPNPIAVTISSEPPNPTVQTSASFSFSVNDDVSTVACRIDNGPLGHCTSPTTQTYTGLGPGSHTFTVQASDAAGNTTTDSYSWAIDAAPQTSSVPSVSGNAVPGQTLTATSGTWSGYPTPTFSYQWQQCDPSGQNCGPISGANGSTYVVQTGDQGHTIDVVVTASNGVGQPVTASSKATPVVQAAQAPRNTSPPTISGKALQGGRLASTTGSWSGYPTPTLSIQWQRCNSRGASCAAITGATGASYALTARDVRSTLRVYVQGTNIAGSSLAHSTATAVVKANTSASIAGVASRKARLRLTVITTLGGAPVKTLVVALPPGLRFSPSKSKLATGITVTDSAGRRVRTLIISQGSLVIKLKRPVMIVKVEIGGQVISVSKSLATSVRHGRRRQVVLTIVFTDTGKATYRSRLSVHVS